MKSSTQENKRTSHVARIINASYALTGYAEDDLNKQVQEPSHPFTQYSSVALREILNPTKHLDNASIISPYLDIDLYPNQYDDNLTMLENEVKDYVNKSNAADTEPNSDERILAINNIINKNKYTHYSSTGSDSRSHSPVLPSNISSPPVIIGAMTRKVVNASHPAEITK